MTAQRNGASSALRTNAPGAACTVTPPGDDGSGARTAELSSYSKDEGISAGFFVNGKRSDATTTTVLADIVANAHAIGNHISPNQVADWDCWRAGSDSLVLDVEQCADLYEAKGYELARIDDVPEGGGKPDPCSPSPQQNRAK
jgi:hypothetical protein